MKARVIKTTHYSPINEGGVVEIVPNMEADAADVYAIKRKFKEQHVIV